MESGATNINEFSTVDFDEPFDLQELDILANLLDTTDTGGGDDKEANEPAAFPPKRPKQKQWMFTPRGPATCLPCAPGAEEDNYGQYSQLLKPYGDLSETVACNGSDINSSPAILVLCEGADDDEQGEIVQAVKEVAEKQPEGSDLLFFYGTRCTGPVVQIREVCQLPANKHKVVLMKLDIPQNWTYYVSDVTDISVKTIETFIKESDAIDSQQYEEELKNLQRPLPTPTPDYIPPTEPPYPTPAPTDPYQKTRAEMDADEIFADSSLPYHPTSSASDKEKIEMLTAKVKMLERELEKARSKNSSNSGIHFVSYGEEKVVKAKPEPPMAPNLYLKNLFAAFQNEPKLILGPKSTTFALSYSKPYLAAGGEDGFIYIFDESDHFKIAARRKCSVAAGPKSKGGKEFEVLRVTWSQDGKTLYVGTASGMVEVLSVSSGEADETPLPPPPPKTLNLFGSTKSCQPCDTPFIDPKKKEGVHITLIASLDHSLDENGELKELKDALAPQVYGVAETGRGRIAVATDDEITVWNVLTASRSCSLSFKRIGKGKTGGGRNPNDIVYVFGMDWSKERDELAVALSDGTVRVINLQGELKAVLSIPIEDTRATNAKWNMSGRRLTTTFSSGHVLLWEFDHNEKPKCIGVYGSGGICFGTDSSPPPIRLPRLGRRTRRSL